MIIYFNQPKLKGLLYFYPYLFNINYLLFNKLFNTYLNYCFIAESDDLKECHFSDVDNCHYYFQYNITSKDINAKRVKGYSICL